MKNNSVRTVVNNQLCYGCGYCAAVCPKGSISMLLNKRGENVPYIDGSCINCGLCKSICGGIGGDGAQIEQLLLDKQKLSHHKYIGYYDSVFIGHVKDDDIRLRCASGGLVSHILIHLLDTKQIDGAIVLGFYEDNPVLTKAYIATTKDEVLAAAKSKYSPATYDHVMKQIIREKNDKKYAFVGLPCHIFSLRKLQLQSDKVKKKIKYAFGLFCGHGVSYKYVHYLLKEQKISLGEISSIGYRHKNLENATMYDHEIEICKKDSTRVYIHYNKTNYYPMWVSNIFKLNRCYLCTDFASEYADISFGDAWLSRFREIKKGNSMIVVRTQQGKRLFDTLLKDDLLHLEQITDAEFCQAHHPPASLKKGMIKYNRIFQRLLLRRNPNITYVAEKFSVRLFLRSCVEYFPGKLFGNLYTLFPFIKVNIFIRFIRRLQNKLRI